MESKSSVSTILVAVKCLVVAWISTTYYGYFIPWIQINWLSYLQLLMFFSGVLFFVYMVYCFKHRNGKTGFENYKHKLYDSYIRSKKILEHLKLLAGIAFIVSGLVFFMDKQVAILAKLFSEVPVSSSYVVQDVNLTGTGSMETLNLQIIDPISKESHRFKIKSSYFPKAPDIELLGSIICVSGKTGFWGTVVQEVRNCSLRE